MNVHKISWHIITSINIIQEQKDFAGDKKNVEKTKKKVIMSNKNSQAFLHDSEPN
jgi:hypothetical protein